MFFSSRPGEARKGGKKQISLEVRLLLNPPKEQKMLFSGPLGGQQKWFCLPRVCLGFFIPSPLKFFFPARPLPNSQLTQLCPGGRQKRFASLGRQNPKNSLGRQNHFCWPPKGPEKSIFCSCGRFSKNHFGHFASRARQSGLHDFSKSCLID